LSDARKKQIEDALRALSADRSSEEGWAALYRLIYPYVTATLFRALGGRTADTYDLAQEFFIKLVRFCEFGAFPSAQAFLGYIHAICLNLARDFQRRRELPSDPDRLESVASGAAEHEQVDARLTLSKVFKELDSEDFALTEYLLKGYNLKEISQITKQTYGSLAVRMHRLKAKLKPG
jgi:RNA polymerase sigma factor (sigma-70 family)